MSKDIKLVGFKPDLDPSTPGIILNGVNYVPGKSGFKPTRSPIAVGLPTLGSACQGAGLVTFLNNSKSLFAGTQTKLFIASGSATWNDISNGTYTGTVEARWRFSQFGNNAYAVNGTDPMQYYNGGSTFLNRGGSAPICSILEQVWPGFLMAFNYNDGVNAFGDGWYCSALNDDTNWVNSIATQSASGRLLDTPGTIRAAKPLGQNIVAYKDEAMYLGTYIGPPLIWSWQLIPGEIGCSSQEAVVNIETAHIFPGPNNFYYFDGTRPIPIGDDLRDWFNININATYKYKMQSLHDRINSLIYFYYADNTGFISNAVVYNYRTNQWGQASLYNGMKLEAVAEFVSGGNYTYDTLGSFWTTYDDLPAIPYDSPFWTASNPLSVIFQSDHIPYSLSGVPNATNPSSSITVNYSGDDEAYNLLDRIRIGLTYNNTQSINLNLLTADYVGGPTNSYGPYTFNGNKVDLQKSARWFCPTFTFNGDCEIGRYNMEYSPEGQDQ